MAAELPGPDGTRRQGFNGRWGGPGRENEFFSWFGVGQAYVGVPFYLVGSAIGSSRPSTFVATSTASASASPTQNGSVIERYRFPGRWTARRPR